MVSMAERVAGFGTTIFSEINTLAQAHQAVNLGQGAPNFDGPLEVLNAAANAVHSGKHNQYAPGYGIASLRKAIAAHEKAFYDYEPDPDGEIVVTVGATEGIFATIMGLTDPGDEVIVLEPFYDSYVPSIQMAGAVPRYVPLRPPTWDFDPDELGAAFNNKTRALILNTPHNPTGKIFSDKELALITELCLEYDVLVITDEVYEHIVFDGNKHHPLIAHQAMRDRTVKISSLGKTFSLTGWKIGWAIANAELITGIQRARQFMSFAVAHPLQVGARQALQSNTGYYVQLRAMYQKKRDLLVEILRNAGLDAAVPQGSYFVMADFSPVFNGGDDVAFAKWLVSEIGVACIPPTYFYSKAHRHIVAKQARFAFCKTNDVLREAGHRLKSIQER